MHPANPIPVLRLFVSSPGDVQGERERVDLVVERLNAEFAGRMRLKTVRWETSYYSSHDTFQNQIPEAADCDVVVAIFRARLGTQLPSSFPTMPSGEPYPSGTAYEVLSAIEASKKNHGTPDIYVFRQPRAPLIELDAADRAEVEAQWGRLREFFETWFRRRSGEFVAAFQEFATTDEFAAKVEDCLRQWLARRGFASSGPSWDRLRLGSPFPGLAAFDEARKSIFFGRSLVIAQATERLRHAGAPFLLIIGASGSGKSSLLRAGLAPKIVEAGAIPQVDLWRTAFVTPDAAPFEALAQALLEDRALGSELAAGSFRTQALLARQLAADPEVALAPLRDALARAAEERRGKAGFDVARPARLALFVDQAERLLLETDPGLAARFAALLSALALEGVAYVTMALRSDAYAKFQSVASLVALREAGATLDLLPPTAAELEEMVTKPVEACDPPLGFERREGHSLAAQLIADARGGDALPLLQITLARLDAGEGKRGDGVLRFSDYGGMDQAVTETANEALATLGSAAEAQLPALVTGLVRDVVTDPVSGDAHPVVGALERAPFEARDPARRALIDAFVAKRLLTTEGDAAGQRVRPTHEALLRIWPQGAAIVREAGDLIRVRRTLEPLTRDWAEAKEADKSGYLDISPALLSGAQRLVERFGADVPADMGAFVAASSAVAAARAAREREEQEAKVRSAQAIAAANRRIAQRTGVGLIAALALAGVAGWQWRVAQTQKNRAEHVLALATETASSLTFDIAQKFRTVTGMPAPLVKDVLDRARNLQEQLMQAGEETPKLKSNHAAALGETALTLLALGDTNAALDLSRRARAIYAELSAADPASVIYRHDLIAADGDIGETLQRQGDLAGSSAARRTALAEADDALARDKGEPRFLSDRALALEAVGKFELGQGAAADALKDFQTALPLAAQLANAPNADMGARNNFANAQMDVGDALSALGDVDGAAKSYEAGRAISKKLADENPDDTLIQRNYGVNLERLAKSLFARRDFAGALIAFQEGEAISQEMADKDPSDNYWRYDLAIGDAEIGETEAALGDVAAALAAYVHAVAIDRKLVARDPSNAEWRTHLWNSLNSVGDMATTLKSDKAIDAYREALALAKAAVEKSPDDVDWRRNLVDSNGRLGGALFAKGDVDGALALHQAGVAAARALASGSPSRADLKTELAVALAKLGSDLWLKRDPAGAFAAYGESVTILRATLSQPATLEQRRRLTLTLTGYAEVADSGGHADESIAAFGEIARLAQGLADETNGDAVWLRKAATSLSRMGDVQGKRGDGAASLDSYRKSLAIDAGLLRMSPEDADILARDASMQEAIGRAAFGAHDDLGALAAWRAAQAFREALAAASPDDFPAARAAMLDDSLLGNALKGAGDADGALAAYRKGLAFARAAAARPKAGDEDRYALADSLRTVGWAELSSKNFAGSAALFAEASPIIATLAAGKPGDARFQRELFFVSADLGDARLELEDRDGALAAYVTARDAAAPLAAGDSTFAELLSGAVDKIGLAANAMLVAGDYEKTLAALDLAAPVAPSQNWLDLIRADALMLLDRADEARPLFLKHRGEKSFGGQMWEPLTLDGFKAARAKGRAKPLMDEIEKLFAPG